MDILNRITELRKMRGWTEYRLAEEADLPQSTINTWYKKGVNPTFGPLEKICKSFEITLSQFFAEDSETSVTLTPEQSDMLARWTALSGEQKRAVDVMIHAFLRER